MHGTSDVFTGIDNVLQKYINYHTKEGYDVYLSRLNTTPEQEAIINSYFYDETGPLGFSPLNCASTVSSAISVACGNDVSKFPNGVQEIIDKMNGICGSE